MKDLKKNFLYFFKRVAPIGLLVLIVLIFFWKVFLKGQVPFPGDFVVGIYYPWLDYKWGFPAGVPVKNPIIADVPSFMFPMQTLAAQMLKSGSLPLWNPYILNGNPLLANFQSAPFSIVNIFYFLTDKVSAWSVQIILQHILAAVFVYVLLRYWKVSKLGAVLGGVIYAFSGFNLIWSQWNGHTLSAAFIPIILYFEDRFIKEAKAKFGVFLALLLALQIYSGYPQVVLYTALAIGILFVFRALPEIESNLKKILFSGIILFIFCALGIGLSAPQWMPGAELLKTSQRTVEYHPFEWAFLPWGKTITFISSDFYGNHATKNWWGQQDYTSNTGFVGVVGVVLAILSISLIKKSREVAFSTSLLIVSLILAFPTPVSVFLWKSGVFGFNAASAHRSLVLWNLAVAILSGFGFDLLTKNQKLRNKIVAILIPAVTLIGFGIYACSLRAETINGVSVFSVASRNLAIPSMVLVASAAILFLKPRMKTVLIFLAIIELFYFGWKFTPFFEKDLIFPTTPVIDFLMSQEKPFRVTGSKVIPINLRMVYGLESPEGYDAVYPALTAKLISSINGDSGSRDFSGRYGSIDQEGSQILDLVNTKYFLALKFNEKGDPSPTGTKVSDTYNNKKFKKVFEDKTVVVLENTKALPRSFMVYDWEVIQGEKQALDMILDQNFPLRTKVILNKQISDFKPGGNSQPKSATKYLKYSENESLIEVKTNKSGLLFVSETFYPGWKVFVDGAETEIYQADFAFRAVKVPAGDHEVRFIYRPESFYRGVKLAAFSALVMGGVIVYTLLEKRRYESR